MKIQNMTFANEPTTLGASLGPDVTRGNREETTRWPLERRSPHIQCVYQTRRTHFLLVRVLAWIEKRLGVLGSVHAIVAIYMIKVCTCSGGRQRSSLLSNAASPTRFEFPPTF